MAKSKYLSKKLLDHSLGVAAYAMPATVYLALFTSADDLASGTLTNEVNGGGYARKAFTMPAAVDDDAGGKVISEDAILFDTATGDWGEMRAWAVMDAPTGGHILHYGSLPTYGEHSEYKKIWIGDGFFVRSGDVNLSER